MTTEMSTSNWMRNLDHKEAVRSCLCMLPMLGAYAVHRGDLGVPLGQAGFLMSALPLSRLRLYRFTNGVIFLIFGLGLYLIGSVVAFSYWPALIMTFFVSLALSFMVGWKMASMLALTFFSVYCAGLNNSVPDVHKITNSYYAFSVAIVWATVVSMSRWFPGHDFASKYKKPGILARVKMGLRMGIGTTISLAIAEAFTFTKLGWAPSASANVIRFSEDESVQRAKLRVIGSVIGALVAMVFFIVFSNPIVWVYAAFVLSIMNGAASRINKLGYFPFYTSIILILYSIADPTKSVSTTVDRVMYNVIGVIISYLVVVYTFPRLFAWLERQEFAKLAHKIDNL